MNLSLAPTAEERAICGKKVMLSKMGKWGGNKNGERSQFRIDSSGKYRLPQRPRKRKSCRIVFFHFQDTFRLHPTSYIFLHMMYRTLIYALSPRTSVVAKVHRRKKKEQHKKREGERRRASSEIPQTPVQMSPLSLFPGKRLFKHRFVLLGQQYKKRAARKGKLLLPINPREGKGPSKNYVQSLICFPLPCQSASMARTYPPMVGARFPQKSKKV